MICRTYHDSAMAHLQRRHAVPLCAAPREVAAIRSAFIKAELCNVVESTSFQITALLFPSALCCCVRMTSYFVTGHTVCPRRAHSTSSQTLELSRAVQQPAQLFEYWKSLLLLFPCMCIICYYGVYVSRLS
jgi:hypothetical protein